MDGNSLGQFKDLGAGLILALSACGSGVGAGIAGMAAIGAWKKNFTQNKSASFLLLAFVGAPLTQTIYGNIVMSKVVELTHKGQNVWGVGIVCGFAIGLSAYWQGRNAAVACDAMGETGKGFGNYLAVLGMTETVALFVMVFSLIVLEKFAGV